MKKNLILFFLVCLVLVSPASGQSWASKWEWPLVPTMQRHEIGKVEATEMTVGSVGWPSTKRIEDPYKAARDGTLGPYSEEPTVPKDAVVPKKTAS